MKGIPLDKIIVGKPATTSDAYNTGYMDPQTLGNAVIKAYNQGKWHGGVMLWQFQSDKGGQVINTACS